MSDRPLHRWASTSARIVLGTAFAAVSVTAVVVGVAAPWPQVTAAPVQVEATPAAAETVLTCDGPLLAQARTVETAASLSVAGEQSVVSGPVETTVAQRDLRSSVGTGPLAFTAAPVDDIAPPVAAAGAASVEAADLRGLAASACRPALAESWLVGGATTTGESGLVLLANPGEVAATVQLDVFGATGQSTPPGGADLVVPAGSQRVIPLAGLTLNEESPVVRVSSTGAPVRASLQASTTRVLTPGGIDQVSAIPTATAQQVVPGVTIALAPNADGSSASAAVVRILSPSADTTANVRVLSASGGVAAEPGSVPLVAGVPSEIDLGALAAGSYAVVVESDAPVVAGVWQTTGYAAGSDFAWTSAAPPLEGENVFAVPYSGAAAALTLVNPGGEAATVELVPLNAEASDVGPVTLGAGQAASVTVPVGSLYRIAGTGTVHAAVTLGAAGALAAYPVWPADAAAQPIVVHP